MSLLGLPPISPELKSITPFLQRADELVKKEPVIAYWCAYYAAQVGISLKAKDNASRNLLLELLGALEHLKSDIGANDAVDSEAVSAAYVENFAVKVFRMADDEDRDGEATRSTAKKFLAAANFFEVLKVFPKSEQSESTEGKIKYAKWKAADIAKAYREGRRPTPGPAGSQIDPDLISPPLPIAPTSLPPADPTLNVAVSPPSPQNSITPRTSPKRTSPPPHMSAEDITRANLLHTPPHLHAGAGDDDGVSPGRWSTTATPGFDLARTPVSENAFEETAAANLRRTAFVSEEMEGMASDDEALLRAPSPPRHNGMGASPPRKVHFSSPPKANGRAMSSSPPRLASSPPRVPPSPSSAAPPVPPPPSHPYPTNASIPISRPRDRKASVSSIDRGVPVPSVAPRDYSPPPPGPPAPPAYIPGFPGLSGPGIAPSHSHPHPPPPPINYHPQPPQNHSLPSPPPPIQLTPSIIAKAQKHCRFAISSLDYEDAEQARKELRAALAILDG
ncbi:Vta1 like-domain-containing protein [Hygrophoropsis aurantiaca]|uniref:Vta1 like-domain-containing protein n=1 Tax=Hygrophoropsis aurantiaca TaxID=72124 RepID=A0ACB8ATA2_9AGAM|nr:Vta1 like-domain-containing protein [Hygrophoropsis aurantiaca]